MTIAIFSIEWYYWVPLLLLAIVGAWVVRARPLDFTFMPLLVISQYVVHSAIAYGPSDPITVFSILFYAAFLFGAQGRVRIGGLPPLPRMHVEARSEQAWIVAARWYLLVYYSVRLVAYPFFSGELQLDERLSAQQDNVVLFVLGLGVMPALAAMFYSGMRPGGRFTAFDALVFAISAIGVLGSGSKGGLAPLFSAFVGVASYLGRSIFRYRLASALIVLSIGATVVLLRNFFPGLEPGEIGGLLLYRVAANTDNLEYLDALGYRPGDFPFSGIGALFPMVARRLGYAYDYSPGVWLHGSRFGVWDGFGPNSGIVIDYFGNLSWAGVLVGLLLGLFLRSCRESRNAVGCALSAIALLAVTDVAMLDIALTMWLAVLGAIVLLYRTNIPQAFARRARVRWRRPPRIRPGALS